MMEELSTYLPGILLAYGAFLLAIASPGPNILAIIGTSMAVGRPSGIALAMGVSAGSFTWAMLTALGLSAVLATWAVAITAIKIAGGLYLLWLAWKAFRSAASRHDIEARALTGGAMTPWRYFRRGYLIQMTNPKAALAWIAIIALGLRPDAPFWVGFVIVAGTTLLAIVIHCLYAVAFSLPPVMRMYGRARRVIQATLGAFFAFAGIRLLTSRS